MDNKKIEEKDYGPSAPKYLSVPLESLDDTIKKNRNKGNKFKNNKQINNNKGNKRIENNKGKELSIVVTIDKNQQKMTVAKGTKRKDNKGEEKQANAKKLNLTITKKDKEGENSKEGGITVEKNKVNKTINNNNGENKNFEIKISNNEEDNIDENLETENSNKEIRCTRFPKCPFGANCHYYHPTKRCTYWPNCAFTDELCKSIHPTMVPCKFKENCTRSDCIYIHPDQQMAYMRFSNPYNSYYSQPMSLNKKIINTKPQKQQENNKSNNNNDSTEKIEVDKLEHVEDNENDNEANEFLNESLDQIDKLLDKEDEEEIPDDNNTN